jgi:hypothetical protein
MYARRSSCYGCLRRQKYECSTRLACAVKRAAMPDMRIEDYHVEAILPQPMAFAIIRDMYAA